MRTREVPYWTIMAAVFAVLGLWGGIVFPLFISWPVAFFVGMATAKGFKHELEPAKVILLLLWAGLWIGIGSIFGWFIYYPAMPVIGFKHGWILFGPAFTAALFTLGGLTYLLRTAVRRSHTGGTNNAPPSDDHGSSIAHRKHNPTPSERRNGLKLVVSALES